MTIALAALSITLVIASILFAVVLRLASLLAYRRIVLGHDDRNVSATPIVGSVVGFFAVLVAPIGSIGDRLLWSWGPLAIEAAVFGLCLAYWDLSGLKVQADRQRRSRGQ